MIDASLARLYGAVEYVHEQALEGFNAGTDVWTLMEQIRLPAALRVGEGYGKVSWAVRTLWESYIGWFKLQSTTELYPDRSAAAMAELLEAAGVAAVLERAEAALARGDAVVAIRLGEIVATASPDTPGLGTLMAGAHQHLLDTGGDVSFWENGWLRRSARPVGRNTDSPPARPEPIHDDADPPWTQGKRGLTWPPCPTTITSASSSLMSPRPESGSQPCSASPGDR